MFRPLRGLVSLDRCCLLFIHEHAEANDHKNNGLPAIVTGHASKVVTGTHSKMTGSMADHRLRCAASQISTVAYALAKEIASSTGDAGLSSLLGTITPAATEGLDEEWIAEAASDLVSKAGASLVLAGSHQPVAVQLLAYGMNAALKTLGYR